MSSPLYTTSMPPPPSFSKTRLMGYGLTTHRKEPAFASHLRPRPQASQREGDYTKKFMGGLETLLRWVVFGVLGTNGLGAGFHFVRLGVPIQLVQ